MCPKPPGIIAVDLAQTEARTAVWMLDHPSKKTKELGIHRQLGIPVYQTSTKNLSIVMVAKLLVPHTEVPYRVRRNERRTVDVAWLRKHKLEDLKTAIATLHMMGYDHIVALRSFQEGR